MGEMLPSDSRPLTGVIVIRAERSRLRLTRIAYDSPVEDANSPIITGDSELTDWISVPGKAGSDEPGAEVVKYTPVLGSVCVIAPITFACSLANRRSDHVAVR